MRRLIAILLAMVMCFSFIGVTAFGDDTGAGTPAVDFGENPAPAIIPGAEIDPVQNPTPAPAPAEPTVAPAEPTVAPAEPTVAPAEPTVAPEEPTVEPTEPTVAPTEPTVAPTTEPTAAPEGGNKPHVEGALSITLTSDKTVISGSSEEGDGTAILTAIVTRSDETVVFPEALTWTSTLASVDILPDAAGTESGLYKTFKATAKFNGVQLFGKAVITAAVSADIGANTEINVVPAQYTATFEDATETDFEFALLNKTGNKFLAGEKLSFGFTDSEKNKDKSSYKDFVWEATMRTSDDTMDYTVYVKANDKNTEFTLYSDAAMTAELEATGNLTVKLTEKAVRAFTASVTGDTELYKTVFFTQEVEKEKDYVFYVAHPEDKVPEDDEFESTQVYSLPLVTIDGDDYNGYKLELIKENKDFEGSTYSRYWQITIPAERVKGDIVIDANRCDTDKTKNTVDLNAVSTGLVPFAEDEAFIGKTIADPEDNTKQNYYFYYIKSDPESQLHPVYYIGSEGHALSPLPVSEAFLKETASNIYKISDIKGNATVTMGYNVGKSGSGNNEEMLIELPSEVAKPGEDYKFAVRTHDMTETQLEVLISVGIHGEIYPNGTAVTKEIKSDDLGTYAEFNIPASAIDGDIAIEAKCVAKVNNRVKFADNYNTSSVVVYPEKGTVSDLSSLKYKSFEFTSTSFILGTYSSQTHIGEVEAGTGGFKFEILDLPLYMVGSKPNVDGTSSDPNVYCYSYDFTGTTMGGKDVAVALENYYSDGSGYHMIYGVNAGQPLTGDVIVKAKLVPKAYSITLVGSGTYTNRETYVTSNTSGYTTKYTTRRSDVPTYRYLFQLNANRAETRKMYLRIFNPTSNEIKTYPYMVDKSASGANAIAQIYGDYIVGPIIAKVLANDEVDVYVTGNRAGNVSFPDNTKDSEYYNGCVAKMNKDFSFTVSPAAKIKIKVGGVTLTEKLQYSHKSEGNVRKYTIPGEYMTGDVTIYSTSTYNITFAGNYKLAKPVNKASPVQYDTVAAGENYSFEVYGASYKIYVGGTAGTSGKSSGGRQLIKDVDYIAKDGKVTIYAEAITDDLVITVTQSSGGGVGSYSTMKTTDKGVDLSIETGTYLVLDDEKIMYMIVVYGDPDENEYVCYKNQKMIWVESYGGYVWFEASDEREEDFADHAAGYVDTLYNEEIYLNLASEAEDPDADIVISEYQEIYNITEDDEISCDVNEDGKVDKEDLKLMRRIFNCDFKDFDDIAMRCFVLADANNSGNLDMCDAVVIKMNFDDVKDKEKEDE